MGNQHYSASLEKRLWAKVQRSEDCWLWMGTLTRARKGYGIIKINGKDRILVHRLSWALSNGEIPEGKLVLHHCDVSTCVNPKHLFLGTQTDNMRDMIAKGRKVVAPRRGFDHPGSKLTQENVDAIMQDNRVQNIIAKDYGVSQTTISFIKTGLRYSMEK